MKRIKHFTVQLLIYLFPIITFANGSALIHFSKIEEDHSIIFSFKFDNTIHYHSLLLSNPERLVIDIEDCSLKTSLPTRENDLIKKIRSNNHQGKNLRLVFDLKQKAHYSSSLHGKKHELIVKIVQNRAKSLASFEKKTILFGKEDLLASIAEEMEQERKQNPEWVKNSSSSSEPLNDVLQERGSKKTMIIIDPGHGGKDPGAIGLHGAAEKDVVLQISKKLQAMLNTEPGFCAVLTRTKDHYIPLRKRLSIARKNHADLFIAVHADAYHHNHATGASVYALSARGATSEAARWLAEKENESELGGLGNELADRDAILRSVLIDLSQTHTTQSSLQIGNNVLKHLGKKSRLHHPSVEQASFVVLKSPDIPSILVETGFLSNATEEEKLTDEKYQEQTAYCIKEGVKQYFKRNSMRGGWFSHRARQKRKTL